MSPLCNRPEIVFAQQFHFQEIGRLIIDKYLAFPAMGEILPLVQSDRSRVVFSNNEMNTLQSDFIESYRQSPGADDPAQSLTSFVRTQGNAKFGLALRGQGKNSEGD